MGERMRQQMRREMADRLLGEGWRERYAPEDDGVARPPDGDTDPKREPTYSPYCGTDSGYHRHLRAGERTCQPCRDAHAEASRERRARRNP